MNSPLVSIRPCNPRTQESQNPGKPLCDIPAGTPDTRPLGGCFSATEPVTSSVDEIEKFASLLERGFLTQDEFDAKKAQLLGLYRSV